MRTDTINLLPIIPLKDWLRFDGHLTVLLSRLLSLEEKINGLIDTIPSVLRDLMHGDWKAGYDLFVESSTEVSQGTKDKLNTAINGHIKISELVRTCGKSPSLLEAGISQNSELQKLVSQELPRRVTALLDNKVQDAHFLPVIRPEEDLNKGSGYVILFRQILSIPGQLVEALSSGIERLEQLPPDARLLSEGYLDLPSGIVSNVSSPHVEHIMQRFSNVFGRIGVPDCPKPYREWLLKTSFQGSDS